MNQHAVGVGALAGVGDQMLVTAVGHAASVEGDDLGPAFDVEQRADLRGRELVGRSALIASRAARSDRRGASDHG